MAKEAIGFKQAKKIYHGVLAACYPDHHGWLSTVSYLVYPKGEPVDTESVFNLEALDEGVLERGYAQNYLRSLESLPYDSGPDPENCKQQAQLILESFNQSHAEYTENSTDKPVEATEDGEADIPIGVGTKLLLGAVMGYSTVAGINIFTNENYSTEDELFWFYVGVVIPVTVVLIMVLVYRVIRVQRNKGAGVSGDSEG